MIEDFEEYNKDMKKLHELCEEYLNEFKGYRISSKVSHFALSLFDKYDMNNTVIGNSIQDLNNSNKDFHYIVQNLSEFTSSYADFAEEDEKTFTIKVKAKKRTTNEVEDDSWFDPQDFVNYLQEKYVVDEKVSYGLDAYNAHAGQMITEIELN